MKIMFLKTFGASRFVLFSQHNFFVLVTLFKSPLSQKKLTVYFKLKNDFGMFFVLSSSFQLRNILSFFFQILKC